MAARKEEQEGDVTQKQRICKDMHGIFIVRDVITIEKYQNNKMKQTLI